MSDEIITVLKSLKQYPNVERRQLFLDLIRVHGLLEVFAVVYEVWKKYPPVFFLKLLHELDLFKNRNLTQIKTLGIITLNFGLGGVERVLQNQLELFTKMGIRCILFPLNEYEEGKTFPIPNSAKIIVLPYGAEIRKRGNKLNEAIENEKIDAVFYPFIDAEYFLFDISIVKGLNQLPCILHYHHSSFLPAWTTGHRIMEHRALLHSFVDLNVVLSPVDAVYYNLIGAKSFYLLNPCSFPCLPEKTVPPHRRKVLWLGRMSDAKLPFDAVKIQELIVKKIPDVQFIMVGGSGQRLEEIRNEVAQRNLQENTLLTGAQIDCRKYYLDADVFLSTSEIEGFQLTLVEALSAGLPVVAYELAYIPPHCDENKGIVTVPMYDTFAAADAIVKLLEDDEYYADMSRKALKQAEKYCKFDFEAEWRKIFEAVCTNQVDSLIAPYVSQDKNFRTFLQYFFLYLPIGSDKLIQKIKDPLNTKIRELTAEQTEAGRRIAKQQKRIAEQDAQITALNARVAELSQPWLKRKIQGGIRCLREHGFIYTVKRLFQKIGNKLCRK